MRKIYTIAAKEFLLPVAVGAAIGGIIYAIVHRKSHTLGNGGVDDPNTIKPSTRPDQVPPA